MSPSAFALTNLNAKTFFGRTSKSVKQKLQSARFFFVASSVYSRCCQRLHLGQRIFSFAVDDLLVSIVFPFFLGSVLYHDVRPWVFLRPTFAKVRKTLAVAFRHRLFDSYYDCFVPAVGAVFPAVLRRCIFATRSRAFHRSGPLFFYFSNNFLNHSNFKSKNRAPKLAKYTNDETTTKIRKTNGVIISHHLLTYRYIPFLHSFNPAPCRTANDATRPGLSDIVLDQNQTRQDCGAMIRALFHFALIEFR